MATSKLPPFPPVRPMDPAYITSFLSKNDIKKKIINGYVKALNSYNESCNKAAKKLTERLKKLNKI
jgi:hypothetical protein